MSNQPDIDLFGNPIVPVNAQTKPPVDSKGHDEDKGLSLSDDEWEEMDAAVEERAKRVSAEKRAAAEAAEAATKTQ